MSNGQAHNPASPYYNAANTNRYSGLSVNGGFGGFPQNNAVTGNFADDDQATTTQDYSFSIGSGYLNWTASTAFAANNYVYSSGSVYKNSSAGTSGATAPTCTSGTCSDGSITWTWYATAPIATREPVGNVVSGNHSFRAKTAAYNDGTSNHSNTVITETGANFYVAQGQAAQNNQVTGGFSIRIGTSWSTGLPVTYGQLVFTPNGSALFRVTNAGGTTGATQPTATPGTQTTADGIQWLWLGSSNTFAQQNIAQQSSGPGNILTIPDLTTVSGSMRIFGGAGSPENVVTANVGSLYIRSDGGASTALYVKESGSGSTGWAAK